MENIIILVLALAIDLAFGEPPAPLHPVVWMGKLISFGERFAPRRGRLAQSLYGSMMVLLGTGLFTLPVYFLLLHLEEFSLAAYIVVGALLLKSTFSVSELRRAASRIKGLLIGNNLEAARTQMRSLVSRDTDGLSEPSIVAATVESVAENTSDSFIAPLFYFLLFGVPGAIAYRVTNTFDSMVGYHGKYEYLGKFAAKLDDILNFIPARLTALMIVIASYLSRKDASAAWRVMLRDHAKTESPNAGWTMGAAAGALNVQLEKAGHYRLGDARRSLSPQTIDSMIQVMRMTMLLWISIYFAIEVTCLATLS